MTFLAGLFAGNKLCKTKYYCTAKKVAKELLADTAESICPCKLVLVTRYNQEEESMITDFSQYEDNKRVSLIINKVSQLTYSKPELRQRRKLRCNLPWGCYRCRGSPSSLREQVLKMNLQTERQSAYDPQCRS